MAEVTRAVVRGTGVPPVKAMLVFSGAGLLVFATAVAQVPSNLPIPLHELNFSPAYSARNGYTNDKTLLAPPVTHSARMAAYDAQLTQLRLKLLNAAKRVDDLKAQLNAIQSAHEAAMAEMNALQMSLRELERRMVEELRSSFK